MPDAPPDAEDEAAADDGVEVAAGAADDVEVAAGVAEDVAALDELEEPELPQPATAKHTATRAKLPKRRIDPDVVVPIIGLQFCRCQSHLTRRLCAEGSNDQRS
jgi:hypothetical protein